MTIGKEITSAFIKAQKEMKNASKDSNNPFFKSRYADLNAVREACLPILNENNIAVIQPTVTIDGKNYVKTILLHESGETIESLTEIIFNKPNDPQAQGSGITYARRYGLQSLVNIGADDDDGNKASEKPFAKLNGIADDKEVAELKAKKKEDDEKKKRQMAENFFKKAKAEFELDFGSMEEVQGLEQKYAKEIKALTKYEDLSSMLIEAIDAAKLEFVGEE